MLFSSPVRAAGSPNDKGINPSGHLPLAVSAVYWQSFDHDKRSLFSFTKYRQSRWQINSIRTVSRWSWKK